MQYARVYNIVILKTEFDNFKTNYLSLAYILRDSHVIEEVDFLSGC